jgi:2-polyprenyl-3-methyl-5-hydroxy-6-metoxy-1,4-benzoquinol methylase
MSHIDVNNEVTIKSLETNRTPDVIESVKSRLEDVYDICDEHLNEDMHILDLGTKDCMFFDLLKEKGFNNFVGVDCCPEVISICKDKGYEMYNIDIQNMESLYDREFDFIFLIHTLEHVPSPETVINECKKILKPNGFIFVEVPIQKYEDPELWGHYHTFGSHDVLKSFFNDFTLIAEDWQKTKSKKPWYRTLFQI